LSPDRTSSLASGGREEGSASLVGSCLNFRKGVDVEIYLVEVFEDSRDGGRGCSGGRGFILGLGGCRILGMFVVIYTAVSRQRASGIGGDEGLSRTCSIWDC
jgi:hypothetical protein